jgi:hypothetical protein
MHSALADLILLLHLGFVLFVVVAPLLFMVGGGRGWRWVRNPWLRWGHLLGIGFVVLQAWLGRICPLTDWEMALRRHAGEAVYEGSFIAHWAGRLLYWEAPLWLFAVIYTVFALLVLAVWWRVPPRRLSRRPPWRRRT